MMDRFFRVVKSNVNNVLSNLEDPEKVLEQAVADMQTDLVKIRQAYAEISATQKRMEKQKEAADKMAVDWYKRAQLALGKGDEELAREALSRRQIQVEVAEGIAKQMALQGASIDKLYSSMQSLELKITDAKREKDAMIARAKTAKASTQVNDMLSNLSGSNSMEAFERMKAKMETMEAKAEVAGELAASSSGANLEDRFKQLEGNSAVDDELEMLRRTLPGSRSVKGELPSGSGSDADAAAPAALQKSELDLEYERLKAEFGKKTE